MRGRAIGCLFAVAGLVAPALAEEAAPAAPGAAASEGGLPDATAADARIDGAFAVLAAPPVLDLTAPADIAAFDAGAARGAVTPPMGYAPPELPESPVDRLFAVGPRPVPVPVPRRRPAVPMVAARVAALDEAAGVGAPSRLAEVPPILAEDGVVGPPRRVPREALPYLAIIKREAAKNKVPLWLALGVGWVESKYDPNLRGSHTVVGLMQVMPSTARFQGYKGTNEGLLDPETNIVWGMKELGWDYAAAKGDACLAIAKYKAGIMTTRISAPAAEYCRRAKTVTGML